RGRHRLVYNDCPRFGGAHLLDVRAGTPIRRDGVRIPFPMPATALPEPVALAPGLVLEELALHATWVTAGETTELSGRARARPGFRGIVEIRLREPGKEPEVVLRRECGAGDAGREGRAGDAGHEGTIPLEARFDAPLVPPGGPVE